MIVIADSSVIVRMVFTADNPRQSEEVGVFLQKAAAVVIPTVALCEAVSVLEGSYKLSKGYIAKMLRLLLRISTVIVDADAVLAGVQVIEDGGDFEDGVIQYTGRQMSEGKAVFASLDSNAVRRFIHRGIASTIPCTI
ncbi:MAG: hypothetical protein IKZ87_03080 [Actinomycetaceae bacterium]|nr:hypothetical protein [Actinomycetaceae bacterium]